jgi:hypothetical protein
MPSCKETLKRLATSSETETPGFLIDVPSITGY